MPGVHILWTASAVKPGVSPEQAQAELNAMMQELARHHPAARGWNIFLNRLDQEIVGNSRQLLLVLLGAVGLVLLIACVNAANLMLARATSRQREIAVRAALGAGRARLIGQMLAESLLIAVLGGTLGTLFAAGGLKALMALLPGASRAERHSPGLDRIRIHAGDFRGHGSALRFRAGYWCGPH